MSPTSGTKRRFDADSDFADLSTSTLRRRAASQKRGDVGLTLPFLRRARDSEAAPRPQQSVSSCRPGLNAEEEEKEGRVLGPQRLPLHPLHQVGPTEAEDKIASWLRTRRTGRPTLGGRCRQVVGSGRALLDLKRSRFGAVDSSRPGQDRNPTQRWSPPNLGTDDIRIVKRVVGDGAAAASVWCVEPVSSRQRDCCMPFSNHLLFAVAAAQSWIRVVVPIAVIQAFAPHEPPHDPANEDASWIPLGCPLRPWSIWQGLVTRRRTAQILGWCLHCQQVHKTVAVGQKPRRETLTSRTLKVTASPIAS